jgi:uncharacterized membrane protein YeaQ/YmgE (transglycosylase-associated protein family)
VALISWIIVGLVAGAVAGRVTNRQMGCATKVAVGVVGALIGGGLARLAGLGGINHFGLRTLLIAAIGAVVFLLVLEAISGRQTHR